jgi:peptidyl-prolyl cis-trans isomerase D
VQDELRERLLEEKAADIIHNRAAKVEDVLASGTSLDELPSDLGLSALTGTIDAQGLTIGREPAPIPGSNELRQAIIAAAFEARPGDPPRLTEVRPGQGSGTTMSSYFALALDSVTPPGLRPFADIKETVAEDVAQAARRRHQEEVAAKLLAAVQGGQSLEDAATVAGVTFSRTPLTGRSEPAQGVPRELVAPLFGLKKGEAGMVETAEAFVVFTPAEIVVPDPAADAQAYQRMREGLTDALGNDVDAAFTTGVRTRAQPQVNRKALDNFVQQ